MTLSLNCKEAGDPVCTHTMYGQTEEELLQNAQKHGIEVHGYTEQTWNEEIAKNSDHLRKLHQDSLTANFSSFLFAYSTFTLSVRGSGIVPLSSSLL